MFKLAKKLEVIIGLGLCSSGVITYVKKKNILASGILIVGGAIIGTYGCAEALNSKESNETNATTQMNVIHSKIKSINYSKGAILFGGTLATCGSCIAMIANPIDTKVVGGAISLASCGLIYSAIGYLSRDLNHIISAMGHINEALQKGGGGNINTPIGQFEFSGGYLICFVAGICFGIWITPNLPAMLSRRNA